MADLFLFICLFIYLLIYLFIYLFIHLFIYQCTLHLSLKPQQQIWDILQEVSSLGV